MFIYRCLFNLWCRFASTIQFDCIIVYRPRNITWFLSHVSSSDNFVSIQIIYFLCKIWGCFGNWNLLQWQLHQSRITDIGKWQVKNEPER
jgi:hypothetical protein